jgi:hypothetical protein
MCKGLNQLADADIAIFYSNPFSYKQRAQAEGRSRRMTSKIERTNIVDILTGGADDVIHGMLSSKHDVSLTMTGLRRILDNQTTEGR